jgi:hypothetical protein
LKQEELNQILLKEVTVKMEDKISKKKLDELVEFISLCYYHVISGIPAERLLILKKELESKEALSDLVLHIKSHWENIIL